MTSDRPVALVTGAARGIGAATALRLARDGFAVACVDGCADDPAVPYAMGTRAELDDVAARCEGIALVADVRNGAALERAVSETVDRFGGLDAVVASAGVIVGGPRTWELDDDAWAANLDVNLTGVWRTAVASVPALLSRPEPRRGRFVAVASAAGTEGHPRIGAYVAAKHGVIGLVRSLAAELGQHGVTANAVCPGSTRSAILEASAAIYDLGSIEEFAQHHAIGRLVTVDEVASAIAWLCAADQGAVTGVALAVDGGMTV